MLDRTNEIYEFGPFRLNVGERILERIDGVQIEPLPEKPFLALVVLAQNAGRLIPRHEFIAAVWPDTSVEENNLEKSIYTIRQALGDHPREARYIETVRKHGYRFIAPTRVLNFEENGYGTIEPAAIAGTQVVPNGPEPGDFTAEMKGTNLDARGPVRKPEPSFGKRENAGRAQQIAVLVFLGGSLLVLGGVLTGLVPNIGGFGARLEPVESAAANGSPAYDLYVRGKVKVAAENREETEAALRILEKAVALDPSFAPTYAQLARAYNTMAFKYAPANERKHFHENAEVAIEKALALDPNLAEAHFARGLILWSQIEGFPHEQVIRSYKRSLELNPNADETHHQLSLVYSHIGLMDEAQNAVERALELNPNNTLARYRSGVYAQYQGHFDEALAIHRTIPSDFTPLLVDRTTAEILIQTGRTEEADRLVNNYLDRFPKDEGGSFTSLKAFLLAKAGRDGEAEEMIRRSYEIGNGYGHFHHSAYNFACTYALLGRVDQALHWLEYATDNGFPNYPYFKVDPNLNGIRQNPAFEEFMERLRARYERYKALS